MIQESMQPDSGLPSGRQPAPARPAPPTTNNQQPATEVLIDAARQRARGVSWEIIAKETPYSEGELLTFSIDRPEIWGPLYARAEKLRLQEAEGEGLAHLTALLKGQDEQAAESAAKELLIHRRHIERRRHQPPRHKDTKNLGDLNAALPVGDAHDPGRETCSDLVPWCLGGEEEPPAELELPILAAARGLALGEAPGSIARETGHDAGEISRWAFVYAKAWDRAWRPARLEAAEFGAALAINRLLDFAAGPDRKLAARAARTLLIHRRHMHWGNNRNRRLTQIHADQSLGRGEARPVMPAASAAEDHQRLPGVLSGVASAEPEASAKTGSSASICGSKLVSWCLGGESSCRIRDGPGG